MVYGRASEDDSLTDFRVVPIPQAEDLGGGRFLFRITHELGVSGPFGYAVRVVPSHPDLAGYTELGLVANASL